MPPDAFRRLWHALGFSEAAEDDAVFTRWAFGPGYGAGRQHPAPPEDDGLLTRIATLSARESAQALRAVLLDAGIRSTVRVRAERRVEVLVFPEDADRARALATSFPAGPPG